MPMMAVCAGSFCVLSIGIDRFLAVTAPNRYRTMNVISYLFVSDHEFMNIIMSFQTQYLGMIGFCAYNAFLILYFYEDQ